MQRRSAPDKKRDGPPPGDPEPAGSENGVYVITQSSSPILPDSHFSFSSPTQDIFKTIRSITIHPAESVDTHITNLCSEVQP
ncbi:hypothetical protein I312_103333 [Cryptococcus bacillisporus CA1280]|uniref:uncharacterized protein n=1 Tax=Cryptococcus bacillisporus CA1280 TaxID=1296109 RepID=UPI003369110A